jgi:hypothetical protein
VAGCEEAIRKSTAGERSSRKSTITIMSARSCAPDSTRGADQPPRAAQATGVIPRHLHEGSRFAAFARETTRFCKLAAARNDTISVRSRNLRLKAVEDDSEQQRATVLPADQGGREKAR